jgi:hypothetical protein
LWLNELQTFHAIHFEKMHNAHKKKQKEIFVFIQMSRLTKWPFGGAVLSTAHFFQSGNYGIFSSSRSEENVAPPK